MFRRGVCFLMLLSSTAAPVWSQGSGPQDARFKELAARFRLLEGRSTGILGPKKARLDLLSQLALLGNGNSLRFIAQVSRSVRHDDIQAGVLRLLAKTGPSSGIVAAVMREHLVPADPYRRMARDFLLVRAIESGDEAWLRRVFQGSVEDRFLALQAMGQIASIHTLESARILLFDKRWKPLSGTAVNCSTLAMALRAFEGQEAARLLLLLKRDKRFAHSDLASLREATRLWATSNLHAYIKISDLASPDAARRAATARFMGEAGIEGARAPLLLMARNDQEDPAVRQAAAEALGRLRIARRALARDLGRLLENRSKAVRLGAIAGLRHLRVRAAAAALVALFATRDEQEARAALAAEFGEPPGFDWRAWLASPDCPLPEGT